jgi:hypothetical protein
MSLCKNIPKIHIKHTMDHKVLQKKSKRTIDAYIEIQQIHTKSASNPHKSDKDLHIRSRETVDTYEKIPVFIQGTKDPRCIQQKETKRPQKSSRSGCYRPRFGRSRPSSSWWSSTPAGGARGRRVELEAADCSSRSRGHWLHAASTSWPGLSGKAAPVGQGRRPTVAVDHEEGAGRWRLLDCLRGGARRPAAVRRSPRPALEKT